MKIAPLLIAYLQSHPKSYTLVRRGYLNAISFSLPDTLIFPYHQNFFPLDRLNAFRVEDEFLVQHKALVRWLAELIDPDQPPVPSEIWLTLSHIGQSQTLLVEVSFE
ncbi:hypothetical protein [Lacticaseibacillus daqingensis]|uniref:hypothetical protein n=1 Tax=Lacticaseibacillus daqingensis TaxID=2486014 RepID=UPI000F7AF8FB|nr:hypothetical protein [Lacticaseibacillus daqingensis]